MSRVINPNTPAKTRLQLLRACAAAALELESAGFDGEEVLDLAVYLHHSLDQIANTVEQTASAWEKRDYWVKADRFRSEWAWVERYSARLLAAVINRQWDAIHTVGEGVRERTQGIKVSHKIQTERAWDGAWSTFSDDSRGDKPAGFEIPNRPRRPR